MAAPAVLELGGGGGTELPFGFLYSERIKRITPSCGFVRFRLIQRSKTTLICSKSRAFLLVLILYTNRGKNTHHCGTKLILFTQNLKKKITFA